MTTLTKSRLLAMRPASSSPAIKASAAATARNITPSPGPPPDDKIVGSWLCDEGEHTTSASLFLSLKVCSQGLTRSTSKPLVARILVSKRQIQITKMARSNEEMLLLRYWTVLPLGRRTTPNPGSLSILRSFVSTSKHRSRKVADASTSWRA